MTSKRRSREYSDIELFHLSSIIRSRYNAPKISFKERRNSAHVTERLYMGPLQFEYKIQVFNQHLKELSDFHDSIYLNVIKKFFFEPMKFRLQRLFINNEMFINPMKYALANGKEKYTDLIKSFDSEKSKRRATKEEYAYLLGKSLSNTNYQVFSDVEHDVTRNIEILSRLSHAIYRTCAVPLLSLFLMMEKISDRLIILRTVLGSQSLFATTEHNKALEESRYLLGALQKYIIQFYNFMRRSLNIVLEETSNSPENDPNRFYDPVKNYEDRHLKPQKGEEGGSVDSFKRYERYQSTLFMTFFCLDAIPGVELSSVKKFSLRDLHQFYDKNKRAHEELHVSIFEHSSLFFEFLNRVSELLHVYESKQYDILFEHYIFGNNKETGTHNNKNEGDSALKTEDTIVRQDVTHTKEFKRLESKWIYEMEQPNGTNKTRLMVVVKKNPFLNFIKNTQEDYFKEYLLNKGRFDVVDQEEVSLNSPVDTFSEEGNGDDFNKFESSSRRVGLYLPKKTVYTSLFEEGSNISLNRFDQQNAILKQISSDTIFYSYVMKGSDRNGGISYVLANPSRKQDYWIFVLESKQSFTEDVNEPNVKQWKLITLSSKFSGELETEDDGHLVDIYGYKRYRSAVDSIFGKEGYFSNLIARSANFVVDTIKQNPFYIMNMIWNGTNFGYTLIITTDIIMNRLPGGNTIFGKSIKAILKAFNMAQIPLAVLPYIVDIITTTFIYGWSNTITGGLLTSTLTALSSTLVMFIFVPIVIVSIVGFLARFMEPLKDKSVKFLASKFTDAFYDIMLWEAKMENRLEGMDKSLKTREREIFSKRKMLFQKNAEYCIEFLLDISVRYFKQWTLDQFMKFLYDFINRRDPTEISKNSENSNNQPQNNTTESDSTTTPNYSPNSTTTTSTSTSASTQEPVSQSQQSLIRDEILKQLRDLEPTPAQPPPSRTEPINMEQSLIRDEVVKQLRELRTPSTSPQPRPTEEPINTEQSLIRDEVLKQLRELKASSPQSQSQPPFNEEESVDREQSLIRDEIERLLKEMKVQTNIPTNDTTIDNVTKDHFKKTTNDVLYPNSSSPRSQFQTWTQDMEDTLTNLNRNGNEVPVPWVDLSSISTNYTKFTRSDKSVTIFTKVEDSWIILNKPNQPVTKLPNIEGIWTNMDHYRQGTGENSRWFLDTNGIPRDSIDPTDNSVIKAFNEGRLILEKIENPNISPSNGIKSFYFRGYLNSETVGTKPELIISKIPTNLSREGVNRRTIDESNYLSNMRDYITTNMSRMSSHVTDSVVDCYRDNWCFSLVSGTLLTGATGGAFLYYFGAQATAAVALPVAQQAMRVGSATVKDPRVQQYVFNTVVPKYIPVSY